MANTTILLVAISFASAGATYGLRVTKVDALYQARNASGLPGDQLTSPGPEILSLTSLQHSIAWANLVWIDMIQAFTDTDDKSLDRIRRWSAIATDLDPKFFIAYYAPAIAFMGTRHYDVADRIIDKGMANIPQKPEFPFLRGYNAYFGHGKPREASEWWFKAGRMPRAPPYIISLAARARAQSGNEREAEEMLVEMIPNLPARQRTNAEVRLKVIRSERILRKYDAACLAYRETHNKMPTATELHNGGVVEEPPFDLFDGPIELDENCRARTEMLLVRDDEAAESIGSQAPEPSP